MERQKSVLFHEAWEEKWKEEERTRGEKGRAESKMNGCGTNAHLICLLSSVYHSAMCHTATPQVTYTVYECDACTHTGQTCCVFDPNLRVCVLCVWCPSHSVLNDLDPQKAPGGYTLSIILYNPATPRATEREAARERSRNTSHKQTGSVAWKSVPWQTRVATAPSWQNALEGNKLDFKINVPPNRNSLSLWLNSCKGQTAK